MSIHDEHSGRPVEITFPAHEVREMEAAIRLGIEFAQECLSAHDRDHGRSSRKNKSWAEQMESDIERMNNALKNFKGVI